MEYEGFPIFDSSSVWSWIEGLSQLAGVSLEGAGHIDDEPTEEEEEESYPPVMSVKDTKAHLDEGAFNRVFSLLKSQKAYYRISLFTVMAMGVGADISEKQLRYIRRVHTNAIVDLTIYGCRQIHEALAEYRSGEPYQLCQFEDDGERYCFNRIKKHDGPTYAGDVDEQIDLKIDEAADDVTTEKKRKVASKDVDVTEEPATKRVEV